MVEFKNLKRVAESELKKLDAMYSSKDQFTETDAKMYDCLMHGLKCQLTVEAMTQEEEIGEEEGLSGRRGRSRTTGRYVSRDMSAEASGRSYSDGFADGYSEAMNNSGVHNAMGGNSGHYPMEYYPSPRRY